MKIAGHTRFTRKSEAIQLHPEMQNLLNFKLFTLKERNTKLYHQFYFQHDNYHDFCHGFYTSTLRLRRAA
jgi:hypothetical protein